MHVGVFFLVFLTAWFPVRVSPICWCSRAILSYTRTRHYWRASRGTRQITFLLPGRCLTTRDRPLVLQGLRQASAACAEVMGKLGVIAPRLDFHIKFCSQCGSSTSLAESPLPTMSQPALTHTSSSQDDRRDSACAALLPQIGSWYALALCAESCASC